MDRVKGEYWESYSATIANDIIAQHVIAYDNNIRFYSKKRNKILRLFVIN